MKMFRMYVHTIMLSCFVSSIAFAHEPSMTLAAYNNKISNISYSVGSYDQHAITFLCQQSPICMYTPLSYEDSDSHSLTKTYFLPRTQCADSQMRYFYDTLHESFKLLGVDLQIDEVKHVNYGLRMTFAMSSDSLYNIVKVVDADKKTVSFNIIAKI